MTTLKTKGEEEGNLNTPGQPQLHTGEEGGRKCAGQ